MHQLVDKELRYNLSCANEMHTLSERSSQTERCVMHRHNYQSNLEFNSVSPDATVKVINIRSAATYSVSHAPP